ncbi:MAG: TolC family protein [Flavipsychrobacter sp.]|nr:TolC family protein [Flavipsychrobacter sp.]
MVFRYAWVILFLLVIGNASAQEGESMLANVDNAYLEKLIAAARANYPKSKANDIKVNLAEMAIKKAKLEWFSIVSFTYLYSPNNNALNIANPSLLNGYQFGFSTSIGSILQRPGEVKVARENYKLAQLSQDEYNLNVVAVVKKLYYAYVLQQTVLTWRTKSLEGAESSLKEMKYKFEKGVESFDNFNRAQAFFSTSIQSKLESEGALLTAKSSLEEIVGVNLESIK